MTDMPKDSAGAAQESETDTRLDRRLFLFRTLTGAAAATLIGTATTVATTTPAEAQRRSVTDSDPYDAAGRGRGWNRPVRRRAVTDNDPYDAAGAGRGWRPPPRRRRVTDSDPYDAAGRGRGR